METRRKVLAGVAAFCAAAPLTASASNLYIIDARRGFSEEEYADFLQILFPRGRRHVSVRILLKISSRVGFDFGRIVVPRRVRKLNSRIIVHLYHGSTLRENLTVNAYQLDRRRAVQLNNYISFR